MSEESFPKYSVGEAQKMFHVVNMRKIYARERIFGTIVFKTNLIRRKNCLKTFFF